MIFLRYYLWIAPHLLLGLLLIGSFRRALHKQLPAFFAFVIFEIIQFVVLFALRLILAPTSTSVYRAGVVIGLVTSTCLQLAVIYQLANTLLLSATALAGALRPLLRWALAALVLAAAVASAPLSRVSVRRVMNIFQVVDFSSSLILAGMLVTVFLFFRALHISWRSWPTGVALGFGVSACINLASAALRSEFGKSSFVAVDVTQMAAFHVAVVVWIVYSFLPDRAPAVFGRGLGEGDLQLWDQELQRMVGR